MYLGVKVKTWLVNKSDLHDCYELGLISKHKKYATIKDLDHILKVRFGKSPSSLLR